MQGMTRKWITPPPSDPASGLCARILEARGFSSKKEADAFLDPKLLDLDDPAELPGANEAGEILAAALRSNKKIVIFGDYDADGITASTVLYHIFAAATGREGPAVYIPDRIDEGYGIRVDAIEKFAAQGVDLVITVDCGITAVEAAERAEELGITLIITDHHKPREDGKLPVCAAIVHPGLIEEPGTLFAGVGVAYQVAWAFARVWSESHSVNTRLKQALLDMIPIVAIGTIADMVPLTKGNRIFARWGLKLLPSTANPGLMAIMKETDTPRKKLNSSHISFGIAPLINAVGRLSQATQAVDLLTHLDGELAAGAAKNLVTCNRKRQKIQRDIIADALEQYEAQEMHDLPIVILACEHWQRGVVGVAAGKCIEKNYKPTILLSIDGDTLIGSARSISGFSIFDALCVCQEDLLSFGGHDMAAGLSLKKENLESFIASMTAYAKLKITPELLLATAKPDVVADLHEITEATALEIEKMGPFGIGNPAPVVQVTGAKIVEVNAMGKEGSHLSMRVGSKRLRCVWWGQGDCKDRLGNGTIIDFVGKIKVNEFRGNVTAEIDIIDIALPSS